MKDLNRWNPEAFCLLGTCIGSWIFMMASWPNHFIPGGIAGFVGVLASFVWMLTYFHRFSKQRLPAPPIPKKPVCDHHLAHYSSFNGMKDLQALFSGEMSSEEYSKKADGPLIESWTECVRCGKTWKR